MRLKSLSVMETLSEPLSFDLSEFIDTRKEHDWNFLYIGKDKKVVHSISNYFKTGSVADDISKAQQLLERMPEADTKQLAAIFIDVALNAKNVEKLRALLSREAFAGIPVIFNQKQLAQNKTNLLKQIEIIEKAAFIDDVIDLHSDSLPILDKISFLKHVKAKEKKEPATEKLFSFEQKIKSTLTGKRVFDIVLSSLAILFLLPLFIFIAIAIKLESKGPVIYNSLRAGRGFKIFKFYKFRSMYKDADKKIQALAHLNQYDVNGSGPAFFKIDNDPRITKVGKFLRNTSLDELPQLFNVLIGDMSIVGNRPLPLYEAETLTTNEFVERFYAPAGITGLWQTQKRGKADMSVEERINLDISYARKYNLFYDLKIIASTPSALLQKSNV